MINGVFKPNIVKSAVKQLGKPGALLPVVLLEVTTDIGRCKQGYDKKGIVELRERIIEEGSAGIFWLFGANMLNSFGDWVGRKFLGIKNPNFSTGRDKARDCLTEGFKINPNKSQKFLTAFKFTKVAASILGTVAFVGWILPKTKQAITRHIKKKEQEKLNQNQNFKNLFDDFYKFSNKKDNKKCSFKGFLSPETMGRLAHNFENHAVYRLGAVDGGILLGRTSTSRDFDEGLRYAFRDVSSSYFYLLGTSHVVKLLNKIDPYKGKNTGIDPMSAVSVNKYLGNIIKDKKMSVEEFEKTVFGTFDSKKFELIKETLEQNNGNISVKDFCRLTSANSNLRKKAKLMAKLQPELNGVPILTDKQAIDVLTDGAITNPRFLHKTLNGYFGEMKKVEGSKIKRAINVLKDKLSFIPSKDIEKQRTYITEYAQSVVEMAKKAVKGTDKPAEITLETLKKASKRNSIFHSSYLVAGIGVSILFLSTIIPKAQYYLSWKKKDAQTTKAA